MDIFLNELDGAMNKKRTSTDLNNSSVEVRVVDLNHIEFLTILLTPPPPPPPLVLHQTT